MRCRRVYGTMFARKNYRTCGTRQDRHGAPSNAPSTWWTRGAGSGEVRVSNTMRGAGLEEFYQIPSRHFEFRVSLRVYCLHYPLGGAVFIPCYPDNAAHAHSRYPNCQGRKDIFSFSKLFYKL